MRLSLRPRNYRIRQGFTLVEMLVVAPIVIIVITGLVAAMVAMVGDALAANSRAATAYDTQDALERIEQDVRIAVNFMDSFNYMTAPQGRDGDTGAFSFTDNKDLILTQQATTGSPYDSSRALVYYKDQPAGCSEDLSTNSTLKTRAIYYLRNGSLWRRSIVDAWNNNSTTDSDTVCGKPWQRDSCPNITGVTLGAAPAATCNTYDEELLKNVTAFTPTFYNSNNVSTTNPLSASAVSVVVTTSKVVGGETITQTSTIRAARRNDIPTDTTTPSAPVITRYNQDIEPYDNPVTVSFQWSSNGASRYKVLTSSDNGATWSDPMLTTNNWVSVSVPYNNMPARVRVTAYNDVGATSEIVSTLYSSRWGKPALINSWVCFDDAEPTYACPAYTVTSSGLVLLRGMAKSGTVGQPMFSLPERIAPRAYMVLPTSSNSLLARVDVNASGDVIVAYGANTTSYVSLENVRYLSKNAPGVTWANSTMGTGSNWSGDTPGTYGTTQWAMDNVGRVYAPAMVTGSTTTPGNNCTGCDYIQIPAASGPDALMTLPSIASGNVYNSLRINPTQTGPAVTAIEAYGMGSTTSWNSINSIFYRNDLDPTWYNLTFANSWVNFAGGYSNASCSVSTDGVVTLRGLIKSGTATSATTVANLPASCPKPAKRSVFLAASIKSAGGDANQVAARVDVLPSGAVMFYHDGNASNRWLSLEGIMYFWY